MKNIQETIAALKGVPTRQELLDLLSDEILDITFDKLSGDERTMRCTLIPEFLPPAQRDDKLSQAKVRNLEESIFVVWAVDLETPAWRSFRYDRIKKVELADNIPDNLLGN